MKVLAVDPGDKRLGLAISDPSGTLARPLSVIRHASRDKDAQEIVRTANEEGAELIVVGWALDSEGEVGFSARKSQRLAEAIQSVTDLPVEMWDESGTTQAAIQSRIKMGVSKKKRQGHLDDVAASILLQDFLNENDRNFEDKDESHGC